MESLEEKKTTTRKCEGVICKSGERNKTWIC